MSRRTAVLCLLGALAGMSAQAQPVKDIRTGTPDSAGSQMSPFRGAVFFPEGPRTWRSDGTPAGTLQIPGLYCLTDGVEFAGAFYFGAGRDPRCADFGLWKTDGKPGSTTLVSSMACEPDQLMVVGGTLFFSACELWKSDGTQTGTRPLSGRLWPSGVVAAGSTLYFIRYLYYPGYGEELWKSDGTFAGTVMVKDICPGSCAATDWSFPRLTAAGQRVFFAADDGVSGRELWTSNGTTQGTYRVADLVPGSGSGDPQEITAVGDAVFFSAVDGATGRRLLFRSDGTTAGTAPVITALEWPSNLMASASALFFSAETSGSGAELWRTDGTSQGTVQVKDIVPGPDGSYPRGLTALGAGFYFSARESRDEGHELWVSDGTEAGTFVVKDLRGASAEPEGLTAAGDRLFYWARDAEAGRELWVSDGTSAGTSKVFDITAGAAGSYPEGLVDMGGVLAFVATDESLGRELWLSDGTEAGTVLLKDIAPEAGSASPEQPYWRADRTARVGDTLVFLAADAEHGAELWGSDLTTAGTRLLKDLTPGPPGSEVVFLGTTGDKLFFWGAPALGGMWPNWTLWRTDGTETGTILLKDVRFVDFGLYSAAVEDVLYFEGWDEVGGRELWRSDGTAGGTYRVKDIAPGAADSDPCCVTKVGSTVFFVASDATGDRELWRTDGTEAGTHRVKDINPFGSSMGWGAAVFAAVGDVLFFDGNDGGHGRELWKSDGTEAGTVLVKDIWPGPNSSLNNPGGTRLTNTASDGTVLYFEVSNNPQVGTGSSMLWRSDGTESGTVELRSDIGSVDQFLWVNGWLYFRAWRYPTVGIWRSDGTAAGTVMVWDLVPTHENYYGMRLVHSNGSIFFPTIHPAYGRELGRIRVPAPDTIFLDGFEGGPAR